MTPYSSVFVVKLNQQAANFLEMKKCILTSFRQGFRILMMFRIIFHQQSAFTTLFLYHRDIWVCIKKSTFVIGRQCIVIINLRMHFFISKKMLFIDFCLTTKTAKYGIINFKVVVLCQTISCSVLN